MKDEKIDRVAGELIEILNQWFAEKRHPESRCELAEQPGSGIMADHDRSKALESLVCDVMRDLELSLITMKASLTALKKPPGGENQQHYLAILEIQVSQLDEIIDAFSSILTVERPVRGVPG